MDGGLKVAVSPDGLAWQPMTPNPVILHNHDINGIAYDPARKRYFATVSVYRPGAWGDGKRRVTIRWWGRDPKIASGHSGIRGFVLQHKRVGGKKGWQTIKKNTLTHRLTLTVTKGRHKFRVRAVDKAGNVGKWHRPLLVHVT